MSDRAAANVVRALVRAAEPLDTVVIATHIETDAELAMAERAGVHAVQGSVAGPLAPIVDVRRIWAR